MLRKDLNITYKEFASMGELPVYDRQLALEAIDAIKGSYAPYSSFNVGAAVRMSDGSIVRGANQENASYPSGLCAERVAVFAASSQHPTLDIESIAIAASKDGKIVCQPVSPCGACRQAIAEYQKKSGKPVSVLMVGESRILKFDSIEDLLPLSFDLD